MSKINLGNVAKIFSLVAAGALVAGFLIWNIYLVKLGFYEFSIIQARYIHTGVVFLVFLLTTLAALLIAISLLKKISIIKKLLIFLDRLDLTSSGLAAFILLTLLAYTMLVFPRLSQALGGAQPRVLSIIASESDIDFLANFGIVKSSSVITENLCVAYENQESVVILLANRILGVKKENFKGFNSVPAETRDKMSKDCSNRAINWLFNNNGDWNFPR